MMGRLEQRQGQSFYSFDLDEAVPDDHLVRRISAVLDLSWVHDALEPHYSNTGRPSIDPELMLRMLILGYGQHSVADHFPFALPGESGTIVSIIELWQDWRLRGEE